MLKARHRTDQCSIIGDLLFSCSSCPTLVNTWTVTCQLLLPLETVQKKDGQGNGSKVSPQLPPTSVHPRTTGLFLPKAKEEGVQVPGECTRRFFSITLFLLGLEAKNSKAGP